MSSTRPPPGLPSIDHDALFWEGWDKAGDQDEPPALRSLLPLEPISEAEERELARRVAEHRKGLSNKLGRPVSVAVAALDLLPSLGRLATPSLVDRQRLNELRRTSMEDAVTGLLNRAAFDSLLERELGRATRHAAPLSLLLLDVDSFKRYNDRYGHVAGDAVLERIAAVIKLALRTGDWCARIGGDELAVIAPHADIEGGMQLAHRIRQRIELALACSKVTASIGAATSTQSRLTAKQLLRAADEALYASKRRGGNTVSHASSMVQWKSA